MGIILLLFLTGLAAGTLGGLLGIGGCVIMMPVIRFGFNFSSTLAVGTTLTAVVFTAASGGLQHLRAGNVDKQTTKLIALSGVLSVLIGSYVFYLLKGQERLIDFIVGWAFIYAAVRMLYEGLFQRRMSEITGDKVPGSSSSKIGAGAGIGFLTGIIGLGGGYALVPSFIYLLRSPMKIAIGTSLASFVWFALVGAIIKIYQGFVDIRSAILLGIGAAIGGIIGARLVKHFKSTSLKALFGIIFLYVSLKYIMRYFGIHL